MTKAPEISVIMSVYNGEKYLAEAIESVIGQTFQQWELIIINDCSNDKTGEILGEYEKLDERIKVHTNEVNLKLPTSLNKGIELAKGKYIARMDADDICVPERLEKQYRFMEEHKEVALSSCRFFTLKNGVYSSGGCGGRCDCEAIRAMLMVANPILHPGVIARAEVLKSIKYDTSLTCTEDLELWTRLAMKNLKMEILPEYLLIYRLHDKQITSTTLERQHKEVLEIEKKYFGAVSEDMPEEMQKLYINSIYFRDNAGKKSFEAFLKWVKAANKRKGLIDNDALSYALFEILAEHKRCGVSKGDIIKMMLRFNPIFLIKEGLRRKKRAKSDGERCLKTAERLGLVQTAGTKVFPVFSKK